MAHLVRREIANARNEPGLVVDQQEDGALRRQALVGAAPAALGAPETDTLCPQAMRPIDGVTGAPTGSVFVNDPRIPGLAGVMPDANFQAPLEVGDYVTFAGIAVQDSATPTAGPWPLNGVAGTYVSAWAVTNNVGIWTAPGANPAYVMVDTALLGTGGLTVLGVGEAAFRTRFEGMTTDTGRNIHLYGIDFNPLTGATSDRDYGTIVARLVASFKG